MWSIPPPVSMPCRRQCQEGHSRLRSPGRGCGWAPGVTRGASSSALPSSPDPGIWTEKLADLFCRPIRASPALGDHVVALPAPVSRVPQGSVVLLGARHVLLRWHGSRAVPRFQVVTLNMRSASRPSGGVGPPGKYRPRSTSKLAADVLVIGTVKKWWRIVRFFLVGKEMNKQIHELAAVCVPLAQGCQSQ